MNDKILYDFNLSKNVCNNLENVVQSLNKNIISAENDNLELLAKSWSSESSEIFATKYKRLISDVRKLRDELTDEIERIKCISRKMYYIEKEAERNVIDKENFNI